MNFKEEMPDLFEVASFTSQKSDPEPEDHLTKVAQHLHSLSSIFYHNAGFCQKKKKS